MPVSITRTALPQKEGTPDRTDWSLETAPNPKVLKAHGAAGAAAAVVRVTPMPAKAALANLEQIARRVRA